MPRTGLYYDDRMLLHDAGPGHPERPERLAAVRDAFRGENITFPNMPITKATREDLLRVHLPEHVDTIEQVCRHEDFYPDPDTQMVRGSWDAALLAAGAVMSACKAVVDGAIDNAYCVVRPPGHHAEEDRAMGFCLFNNLAVGGKWLLDVAGVERLAIIDWDVHHGNGTQQAFYNDRRVWFGSIHQHPLFPGTGWPSERGGHANIMNIQMHPGSGGAEWRDALQNHIMPALKRFDPSFLLVSLGFDMHRLDPIGSQRLENEDFDWMTRQIKGVAGGRVVSVLEGGYNLEALAECSLVHYRALSD